MNSLCTEQIDWQKMNGLIPVIIQDAKTAEVLMLGYMNEEALKISLETQRVTFYSRSKQRLWTKGESTGAYLELKNLALDCDNDSLLIQASPLGPTCHKGFKSCFQPALVAKISFLNSLINLIQERAKAKTQNSYTAELLASGINRCAQKVGEEAVETVIAAVANDREEMIKEASDLVFHLLVLLEASELNFYELIDCLMQRASLKG